MRLNFGIIRNTATTQLMIKKICMHNILTQFQNYSIEVNQNKSLSFSLELPECFNCLHYEYKTLKKYIIMILPSLI